MKRKPKHDKSVYLKEAWKRGLLSYKLRDYQVALYSIISQHSNKKVVLNCSRRFGKTTVLCLFAIIFGLKNKKSLIRFVAPTFKSLRKIVHPIVRQLIEDAPLEYRPVWKSQEGYYYFPSTQSELHLYGTDNQNYESLRGSNSHLNIIDEAGICSELDYFVRSILIPMTLTTNGRTIMASTPPDVIDSDFKVFCDEAKRDGYYFQRTIYDNKSIPKETILEYAKEAGCVVQDGVIVKESTTWLREYGCQFVMEEGRQICPEWDASKYVKDIPQDDLYQYWHKYVGMDLGVKHDFTAAIFGYYHFKTATLIIEDEFHIKGDTMTTLVIKDLLKNKEKQLWGNLPVYRRISDNNNPLLIQDLSTLHNISFGYVEKDELHAMVNELRLFIGAGRLKVNPRCTYLIECLNNGAWDKNRKEFDRSVTCGHFDGLAALMYLVRSLDFSINPVPILLGISENTHWINEEMKSELSGNTKELIKLFKKG